MSLAKRHVIVVDMAAVLNRRYVHYPGIERTLNTGVGQNIRTLKMGEVEPHMERPPETVQYNTLQ